MPHSSPRSIPAAALGDLSPIDTRDGELFGSGRIPPRSKNWDYTIVRPPTKPLSPLQLPSPQQQYSPQRHSPYRARFHIQPRITEEEASSSNPTTTTTITSSNSDANSPTLPPRHENTSGLSLVGFNLPQGPAVLHSPKKRECQPGKITSHTAFDRKLYEPRAIDFVAMMDRASHCIFRRAECTDTVQRRPVCWTCLQRVKRLRRKRERVLWWVGLLLWVALQSAVVGIVVYLIMAAKHKRAMSRILDRTGAR